MQEEELQEKLAQEEKAHDEGQTPQSSSVENEAQQRGQDRYGLLPAQVG